MILGVLNQAADVALHCAEHVFLEIVDVFDDLFEREISTLKLLQLLLKDLVDHLNLLPAANDSFWQLLETRGLHSEITDEVGEGLLSLLDGTPKLQRLLELRLYV